LEITPRPQVAKLFMQLDHPAYLAQWERGNEVTESVTLATGTQGRARICAFSPLEHRAQLAVPMAKFTPPPYQGECTVQFLAGITFEERYLLPDDVICDFVIFVDEDDVKATRGRILIHMPGQQREEGPLASLAQTWWTPTIRIETA
jgi:hypothetical protein